MKPEIPDGTGTRGTLALLAALAGAKAAGIVLLADALATAIAHIAAGGVADAQRLLWWGTAGVLLRAAAAWATELAARRAGLGAKETLRARLVASALAGRAPDRDADAGTARVEDDGAARARSAPRHRRRGTGRSPRWPAAGWTGWTTTTRATCRRWPPRRSSLR